MDLTVRRILNGWIDGQDPVNGWRPIRPSTTSTRRTLVYAWFSGVYFVKCQDFIKIGYGCDVRQRLNGLRVNAPFSMTPLGFIECASEAEAQAIEAMLHDLFSEDKVAGRREWFQDSQQIRQFIQQHAGLWPAPKVPGL